MWILHLRNSISNSNSTSRNFSFDSLISNFLEYSKCAGVSLSTRVVLRYLFWTHLIEINGEKILYNKFFTRFWKSDVLHFIPLSQLKPNLSFSRSKIFIKNDMIQSSYFIENWIAWSLKSYGNRNWYAKALYMEFQINFIISQNTWI